METVTETSKSRNVKTSKPPSRKAVQRKRNLYALHCAMVRHASEARQSVQEYKAGWLLSRFGVEHSTDLTDPQLWDALDLANGKIPFGARKQIATERRGDEATKGKADLPITSAQMRKLYNLARQLWGGDFWQPLRGFIRRQTGGAVDREQALTVGQAQRIISAMLGQSNKCGLGKRGAESC